MKDPNHKLEGKIPCPYVTFGTYESKKKNKIDNY